MTVHLLIIEDDENFVDEIHKMLDLLPEQFKTKIARSRDEAFSMIEQDFLDLIVLDLKIPTISGALDADSDYGHAVFHRIRLVAPGTPIFILTGSPAEDFIPALLEHQQQIDIWSEGRKRGNILFLNKYKANKFPERLGPIAIAIECLSDVELDRGGLTLSLSEDRLIRIFTKKFQGVRCAVSSLGRGLSGARIIRLRITDNQGVQVHNAVAKLAGLAEVRKEAHCYDHFMSRLGPALTPRNLGTLEFGAHTLAGIFFGLAEDFEESAFDVVRDARERVSAVICNVEAATARWVAEVPETRRSIREYRQRVVNDQTFEELREIYGLEWATDFEKRKIQTRWACVHGDLNGCNILASVDSEIVLIDYSEVGEGPASLDPVTLELSLLFHPDAAGAAGAWPNTDQARAWGDLDNYLVGCPFPEFICECRRWAFQVAAGKRDIAASAYSYLLRQLKYDDTNKELVAAFLDGVRRFYDEST